MKVLKSQKEILIGTCIFAVIYFLMWAMLYTPIVNQNTQLKNYLEDTNNMIDTIEATVSQKITLAQAMGSLNLENERVKKAFGLTPDDSIGILTKMAQQNKLEIQSTDHHSKDEPSLIDSQTASVLKIREEIVQLKLTGRFADLLAYLGELRTARNLYLDIDRINVIKPAGSDENCEITLDLKLFLSV